MLCNCLAVWQRSGISLRTRRSRLSGRAKLPLSRSLAIWLKCYDVTKAFATRLDCFLSATTDDIRNLRRRRRQRDDHLECGLRSCLFSHAMTHLARLLGKTPMCVVLLLEEYDKFPDSPRPLGWALLQAVKPDQAKAVAKHLRNDRVDRLLKRN